MRQLWTYRCSLFLLFESGVGYRGKTVSEAAGLGGSSALQEFESELQGQIATALSGLESRVEESFDTADARLEAYSVHATSLVDAFVEHARNVRQRLETARSQAEARATELAAVQAEAAAQVQETESLRDQGMALTDEHLSQSEAAGDALDQTSQELLGRFTDLVDTALSRLQTDIDDGARKLADLSSALSNFGDHAEAEIGTLVATLADLGEETEQLLEQLRSVVEGASTEAETRLASGVGSSLDTISSAAKQASAAADKLAGFAGDFGGEYRDEIDDVISTIKQVLDLIDRIRPILELAEKLT